MPFSSETFALSSPVVLHVVDIIFGFS